MQIGFFFLTNVFDDRIDILFICSIMSGIWGATASYFFLINALLTQKTSPSLSTILSYFLVCKVSTIPSSFFKILKTVLIYPSFVVYLNF